MNTFIIKNKTDLNNYIAENGDCDADIAYLSMNKEEQCFVICGCTYASEAFRYVNEEFSLVITDDDYEAEIENQMNSDFPEDEYFYLKKMYMNIETGSVDTRDGWYYKNEFGDTVNAVDLGEVIEVQKDENGDWVEAQ